MEPRERAIATLDRLVAVPTVARTANAAIVELVQEVAAPLQARIQRVPSPLGDQHGLILSVGPDTAGGVILSGHLDVVPVEGQAWTSDPFRLRRAEGRLYGRGTCDMKGFVACALATLFAAREARTASPVHLVLSADEETSCRSVESLVETVMRRLPPVRGVIVGEATRMLPADRHKASATIRVEVTGHAVHASIAERGVNAVSVAARLIGWLDAETAASAGAPERSLHSATTILGGIASNTLPDRCVFDWDMRLAPGARIDDVLGRFDAFARMLCDGAGLPAPTVAHSRTAWFPGLDPRPASTFGTALLQATGSDRFLMLPYGTEAGFFQAAGFETFVCGPGDPTVAHLADEHLEEGQIAACLDVLARLTYRS
jgi:acetylornithine deacetylase